MEKIDIERLGVEIEKVMGGLDKIHYSPENSAKQMALKINEIIDWIQKEEARQNAKLPEGVTIDRD